MRIREYTPGDLDDLRRLHAAQGFGYPFPDLDNPLFLSKLVLEEDNPPTAGNENAGREVPGREVAAGNSPPADSSVGRDPRIVMAVLQRLTAEAYLLHDPAAGTPPQRWQRFLALHEAALQDARSRGLADAQAFLPPRVARAFGRRLARLGWVRDPWPCFTRSTL